MGLGYLAAGLMAGMLSITAQAMSPISVMLLGVVPLFTYLAYQHVIRTMNENTHLKEATATN